MHICRLPYQLGHSHSNRKTYKGQDLSAKYISSKAQCAGLKMLSFTTCIPSLVSPCNRHRRVDLHHPYYNNSDITSDCHYLFFLPEEVRAGADSSALVGLLEQLGAVAGCFVHQHIAVLGSEDAASVQRSHDALQRCHLGLAVWYCFFVQYEGLRACTCVLSEAKLEILPRPP